MKTLALKEIRLLLPAWTGALLLAIGMLCLFRDDAASGYAPVYIFAIGALLLALTSFGREFNLNTFAVTLAQPVERTRIWRTKMSVLVLAISGIWLLWFGILFFLVPKALSSKVALAGLIAAPVAFSSGLWSSLLVRQIVGAFWFALLVPCLLMMIVDAAKGGSFAMAVVLVSYSIAGYWWARRLFLTAQETAWASGLVLGPAWRRVHNSAVSTRRTQRRFPALLRKELRLQQTTLIAMAWLFLLHLVALGLRKFTGESELGGNLRHTLEMFGGLWLLVPVISGALAIAEERKLGTLPSQVCLPVSTKAQVALKLGLALLIGGLGSGLLVWGLESIGQIIGAGSGVVGIKTPFHSAELVKGVFLLTLLALAGFYGSSVGANIVQAIVIALAGAVAAFIVITAMSELSLVTGWPLWDKNLFLLIAWPASVVVGFWLIARNYRVTAEHPRLLRRNVVVWVGALATIVLLTFTVYQRAWELVMPLEPAPGPARLKAEPGNGIMEFQNARVAVRTEGGLWYGQLTYYPNQWLWSRLRSGWDYRIKLEGSFQPAMKDAQVLPGAPETLILRTNGTLWTRAVHNQGEMRQVGKEDSWKTAAWENTYSVILLKDDGSLWRLGKHDYVGQVGQPWPGLASFAPEQIGSEGDWDRLMQGGDAIFAWQRNGEAWVFRSGQTSRDKANPLAPGLGRDRVAVFDKARWRSVAGVSRNGYRYCFGVRENGELWVERSSWFWPAYDETGRQLDRFNKSIRIGSETNWVGVAGTTSIVAALKKDGALWQFDLDEGNRMRSGRELKDIKVSRLGSRTDWLDLKTGYEIVTLAADGTVWMWNSRSYEYDSPIRPSRKPLLTGNIFSASNRD